MTSIHRLFMHIFLQRLNGWHLNAWRWLSLLTLLSCVSIPGEHLSQEKDQTFRQFWRGFINSCLEHEPFDLAGSVRFNRTLVPFEAAWSVNAETMHGSLITPLGSAIATFKVAEIRNVPKQLANTYSCSGRCPTGLGNLLNGLGPRGFKALVCGGPGLLAAIPEGSLKEDRESVRWRAPAKLFERDVRVNTQVEGWESLPSGRPLRIHTEITSGLFSSTLLTATWRGCAQPGSASPHFVDLQIQDIRIELTIDETSLNPHPTSGIPPPCKN
jgi:hypothetical protein